MSQQCPTPFITAKLMWYFYLFSFARERSDTLVFLLFLLQAQSDDDEVGPDDVAVNVEGRDGFMDAFFAEASRIIQINSSCITKKYFILTHNTDNTFSRV